MGLYTRARELIDGMYSYLSVMIINAIKVGAIASHLVVPFILTREFSEWARRTIRITAAVTAFRTKDIVVHHTPN